MRRWFAAAICVALCALPSVASALTVTEVARELRCITCGTTLDVSHADSAERLKVIIQNKIDAGWTKSQIVDFMEGEFGREILAIPPKSGFDLVAWVVPPVLILGGLILVVGVARRSRLAAPADVDDVGPVSPEETERLRRAVDG